VLADPDNVAHRGEGRIHHADAGKADAGEEDAVDEEVVHLRLEWLAVGQVVVFGYEPIVGARETRGITRRR